MCLKFPNVKNLLRVLEVKKLTNKNVSQLKQQCLHFEGAPPRKFFNLQDPFEVFL